MKKKRTHITASASDSALKQTVKIPSSPAALLPMRCLHSYTRRSHTFMNADGTRRITLGNHVADGYDNTVEEGIAIVKEFLNSLAKDDESKALINTILRLMSRDMKGNLKASRVIQLRRTAEDLGNERFLEGVRIIEESYRPELSKQYIRAEYKNEDNALVTVPLGMTES